MQQAFTLRDTSTMKGLKTTVHKEALSRCSLQVLTRASNVRDVKGTLVLDDSLFANAQSCCPGSTNTRRFRWRTRQDQRDAHFDCTFSGGQFFTRSRKEAQLKREGTGRKLINVGSDGEKHAFKVEFIVGVKMTPSVPG